MQTVGSRAKVMHGTALKTSGGLRKRDLKYNKSGKIVSKKASASAKRCNNLGLMKGGSIFTRDKKFHKKRSCKSKDKPEGNFWKIYKCLCENKEITVSEGNQIMGKIISGLNVENENVEYKKYISKIDLTKMISLFEPENFISMVHVLNHKNSKLGIKSEQLFTKIFKIVKGKTVFTRYENEKIVNPDEFFGTKSATENYVNNVCKMVKNKQLQIPQRN